MSDIVDASGDVVVAAGSSLTETTAERITTVLGCGSHVDISQA
jgi:hypothetical protein